MKGAAGGLAGEGGGGGVAEKGEEESDEVKMTAFLNSLKRLFDGSVPEGVPSPAIVGCCHRSGIVFV